MPVEVALSAMLVTLVMGVTGVGLQLTFAICLYGWVFWQCDDVWSLLGRLFV